MKKFTKKIISMVCALAVFTCDCSIANANEVSRGLEDNAQSIIDVTGTEDANLDYNSSSKYTVIADGNEALVKIPESSNDEIIIDDGLGNTTGMQLPEEVKNSEAYVSDSGIVMYQNSDENITIGVQSLQESNDSVNFEGYRTTIVIDDANAQKDYSFEYNLDEGCKLISAAEYLGDEYDTGEVYLVDNTNQIISIIDAPWAKDANGNELNTYYVIEGNKIIQHIDFDENTAFPVVADPSFWQVTKCAGTVLWVIGTTIFTAAKIVKIKKAIKAAGGVRKAAKGIIAAIKASKKLGGKWWTKIKWSDFGSGLAGFGADLIGISDIRSNCSF